MDPEIELLRPEIEKLTIQVIDENNKRNVRVYSPRAKDIQKFHDLNWIGEVHYNNEYIDRITFGLNNIKDNQQITIEPYWSNAKFCRFKYTYEFPADYSLNDNVNLFHDGHVELRLPNDFIGAVIILVNRMGKNKAIVYTLCGVDKPMVGWDYNVHTEFEFENELLIEWACPEDLLY